MDQFEEVCLWLFRFHLSFANDTLATIEEIAGGAVTELIEDDDKNAVSSTYRTLTRLASRLYQLLVSLKLISLIIIQVKLYHVTGDLTRNSWGFVSLKESTHSFLKVLLLKVSYKDLSIEFEKKLKQRQQNWRHWFLYQPWTTTVLATLVMWSPLSTNVNQTLIIALTDTTYLRTFNQCVSYVKNPLLMP